MCASFKIQCRGQGFFVKKNSLDDRVWTRQVKTGKSFHIIKLKQTTFISLKGLFKENIMAESQLFISA